MCKAKSKISHKKKGTKVRCSPELGSLLRGHVPTFQDPDRVYGPPCPESGSTEAMSSYSRALQSLACSHVRGSTNFHQTCIHRHLGFNTQISSTSWWPWLSEEMSSSKSKLRACMLCSFVQTAQQFKKDGCPNCDDLLEVSSRNWSNSFRSPNQTSSPSLLSTQDQYPIVLSQWW